ncbi:MAG: zinc-binding dehydrogenase, partial [Bifidobacteriaceae bacterium]|nr:zinc-binding dehydrogenase [Bifidobacteriaceae bacterium]
QIVAIDDETDIDLGLLKAKALSWHWEFMFARSMHRAQDLVRQHEILDALSGLVDSGTVRATLTTELKGLNAANLRRAHEAVETGHMVGKIVVAGP